MKSLMFRRSKCFCLDHQAGTAPRAPFYICRGSSSSHEPHIAHTNSSYFSLSSCVKNFSSSQRKLGLLKGLWTHMYLWNWDRELTRNVLRMMDAILSPGKKIRNPTKEKHSGTLHIKQGNEGVRRNETHWDYEKGVSSCLSLVWCPGDGHQCNQCGDWFHSGITQE